MAKAPAAGKAAPKAKAAAKSKMAAPAKITTKKYEFCKVERDGRLFIVTINRPEVMNALHPPASWEMQGVWDDFAADPDLWVGIITGAGDRAFSAGNDLKFQAAGNKMVRAPKGFAGITNRYDLNKPLIAAVNGIAMGGGFETALACDLMIASENALFALPEPRVGLTAGAGGMHRLPRVIPMKQALGMILTGRRVGAAEALKMGFVNEVVPQSELMAAARRWADLILECSPMSVKASKEAVYKGMDMPTVAQAINTIYPAGIAHRYSKDYVEGPKAFSEKRKPNWTNEES